MNVLVVGGGGREHAICHKLSQSGKADKIYCVPGNAGISEIAEIADIPVMNFKDIIKFAKEKNIGLTVVGMDDPLCQGIVDEFKKEGLRVFGPSKNAARLEGSKSFAKHLMKKYGIPTATYEVFDNSDKAKEYLKTVRYPIAVKADGPALGKGVLICSCYDDAYDAIEDIMVKKIFGTSGDTVIIEEFITGPEVSVLSFCDGKTVKAMASSQDHKRIGDGDTGLNTGGMGAFSPSPFYTKDIEKYCIKNIYEKTLQALNCEGIEFKGVIFFGLMLTKDGPKVLEYNVRFGDPETQTVLVRMENDIIDIFEACIDGTLDKIELKFEDNAAACVILASAGYPQNYEKGMVIKGLDKFNLFEDKGFYCFHAGTKKSGDNIVTAGGRVLGITAKGKDIKEAVKNAYSACEFIDFKGKYNRTDIGKTALEL